MSMKTWRVLFLLLSGAILVSCAALKESIRKPEVSTQAARITGVTLNGMDVAFVLGVKNPNPMGFTLEGLSYKLDIENKQLLRGRTKQRLKVAAKGNSSLKLPLSLAYKGMFDGVSALLNQDKIRYALNGELDFGLIRLPYKTSGTLDLPSLPRVSIGMLKVKRLTYSGMDVEVGLDMNNDNSFPLKLRGVDYNLKIAGSTVARGKSLAPISLSAGKQGRLKLGMRLLYKDMGSVIGRLKGGGSIPVVFDGRINVPGLGAIPLNWSGNVEMGG